MKNNPFEYEYFDICSSNLINPDTVFLQINNRIKFKPGQFVQVALNNFGEGTFAPCNDTDSKTTDLCIRGNGNLTNQLIQVLPGDKLKIRGPYGNGWPIGRLLEKNIIILSGGLGLVPFRPLLIELLKNRTEFKKIHLFAGFKNEQHIIFKEDLINWKKHFDVTILLEHGRTTFSKTGLITDAFDNVEIWGNSIVLICGPEIMYQSCLEQLKNFKVEEKNIYLSFERRMECGIGLCQHCNIGKYLVCQDGPIFRYDLIKEDLGK